MRDKLLLLFCQDGCSCGNASEQDSACECGGDCDCKSEASAGESCGCGCDCADK